jgi:Phosphoesterase family
MDPSPSRIASVSPSFSWYTNSSDEDGDMTRVINEVMRGLAWEKRRCLYDEHGGWYDQVPQQPAVKPDKVPPALEPGDLPGAYDCMGFRVRYCVVSARSKRDYV